MDIQRITETLKIQEGFRREAYKDHLGFLTIGFGRMIDKRLGGGITEREATILLENDIANVIRELDRALPWVRSIKSPADEAVVNMAFQMGLPRLQQFRKTLEHLKAGRYQEAAAEALDSRWAQQTPNRAREVVDLIRQAGE